MKYRLVKHITQKKSSSITKMIQPLIFVFMIPVFIIAFLSSLLVSSFVYLKELIAKTKTSTVSFHEELSLIDLPRLKITIIEDETDEELRLANEAWAEKVFGQHTYLYRVNTSPVISGLHNSICGFYLLEKDNGIILQQLNPGDNSLNTRIIFLDYHSNEINVIEDIGPFYLYNDEKTGEIKGFNETEEIQLEITSHIYPRDK